MSNLPKFNKPNNLGEFVILGKKLKKRKDCNDKFLELIVKNEMSSYTVYCFENAVNYNNFFEVRDRISIKGFYSNFRGYTTIIASKIDKEVSIDDYLEKLEDINKEIKDEDCKLIINEFLDDFEFMDKFMSTPASLSSHHSFKGGLLVHTVTSMEFGLKFSEIDVYRDKINKNILLTGLFLHDIGKIYSYTEDGKLTKLERYLGHIVMGEKLLDKFIREKELNISNRTYLHLNHIILTHHGPINSTNYGLRPMTNEAKLVNKIESLDAEINEFNLKIA